MNATTKSIVNDRVNVVVKFNPSVTNERYVMINQTDIITGELKWLYLSQEGAKQLADFLSTNTVTQSLAV